MVSPSQIMLTILASVSEILPAKVEASKNGRLIYTDYLSLLKFEDDWKIVAKVYNAHK